MSKFNPLDLNKIEKAAVVEEPTVQRVVRDIGNEPTQVAFSLVKDTVNNSYKVVKINFKLGDPNIVVIDDQKSKDAAIHMFKISVAKSGLLN